MNENIQMYNFQLNRENVKKKNNIRGHIRRKEEHVKFRKTIFPNIFLYGFIKIQLTKIPHTSHNGHHQKVYKQ